MRKSKKEEGNGMLFFDTSAAIEWLRGNKQINDVYDGDQIAVSVLSVYELLWAAERKNKNTMRAAEIFIESCHIIQLDIEDARLAAFTKTKLIKKGADKSVIDILISATAERAGLRLVTFDNDFRDIAGSSNLELIFLSSEKV